MVLAIGCVNCSSIAIKYFINSDSSQSIALISFILKTPLVTVPVLSITNVFILVIASIKDAPLNRIPFFEAAPKPPKYPKGIEITKAQGQEITKKIKALYNQSLKT